MRDDTPNILPWWIEFMWLARDKCGHVAGFMPAVYGPAPSASLRAPAFPVVDSEERLLDLPPLGKGVLESPEHGLSLEVAARGVYIYDWRPSYESSEVGFHSADFYERVARPTRPIVTAELPSDLRSTVELVTLGDLRFSESLRLRAGDLPGPLVRKE